MHVNKTVYMHYKKNTTELTKRFKPV